MIIDSDGYVIATETCPAPPYPWALTASVQFAGNACFFLYEPLVTCSRKEFLPAVVCHFMNARVLARALVLSQQRNARESLAIASMAALSKHAEVNLLCFPLITVIFIRTFLFTT